MTSHHQQLDDPAFPQIHYRRGRARHPIPVLRGTGIRVQTLVVAARRWGVAPQQIAAEYGLSEAQVHEALAFYTAHQQELDLALAAEEALEADAPHG